MSGYLKLKQSNCKDCYKCIRQCPVKSISFSNHQAQIIEDECILCGMCFVICPQNAKEIRNDIYKAKVLIKSGKEVYASIAPSFIANFEGYNLASMKKALKALGFKDVFETAVGAKAVKDKYDELVNMNNQDVIISTCCHTVNLLIEKHYKEAIPYLAKVKSPMHVHALQIKKDYPNSSVVFIGPCISKKHEAELYPDAVDCVLTFEELSQWMNEENIILDRVSETEKEIEKGRTRLFPTSGGILKTMNCSNPEYTYMEVDGVNNCISAIENILSGNVHKCFIEMSACIGSCIGGPAIAKKTHNKVKDFIEVNKYSSDKDFTYNSNVNVDKDFIKIDLQRNEPSEEQIRSILNKMGKYSIEKELNCGSCGYNTCREKAKAIFLGKAEISMCLPFLKEKAESFSDNVINNTPNGILVLNDSFEIQLMNKAFCEVFNICDVNDYIGQQVSKIMDPEDFVHVSMHNAKIKDKQIKLTELNKIIEQTIVYDDKYHIMICIIRNITQLEKAKEEKLKISKKTIDITDQVILKQMRVVQEIASLLGETTAETKVALSKLKDSLKDE